MARKVYSIKVPAELMERVDGTVARFVHTRRQAPISRNEFIERAILHELQHLERSRRKRGTNPVSVGPAWSVFTRRAIETLAENRKADSAGVGNTAPSPSPSEMVA